MSESEILFNHPYYNRDSLLSLLRKRIASFSKGYRQNVALAGPQLLGKSHLLRKLFSENHGEDLMPIYIEMLDEPFEYFSQRFMGSLLFGLLKAKGRPATGDFTALITRSKRYIPRTLNRMRLVKRLIDKGRVKEGYTSLLALPRYLAEETGMKLIIMMDEFDRLADYGLRDPFKELGSELMMQKDALFIVSSSRFQQAKSILRGKLSLLFGNFELIEVKSLSFDESREFISLFLGDITIKEPIVKFLIQITDGNPYYLNVLLGRMKTLALMKDQSITETLMVQALTDELYLEYGALNLHFSNQISLLNQGRSSYLHLTALLGVALGKRRVRELSRYLERSQGDTKKVLNRLVEKDILIRAGSFHTLHDPLYIFWLKSAFAIRKRDLGVGTRGALDTFKDSVMNIYDDYLLEDKKLLSKRLEELLKHITHDDVLELGGKRFRGQDFSEVTTRLSEDGETASLLAKSSQVRWMCHITNKPVEEDAVSEYIEILDRHKKPIKNRIMVATSGIGLNAKLLAQESRIHVWDLKNLNFLLSLFGKSKIIPNG